MNPERLNALRRLAMDQPKGPTMTTISDHAEALAMYEAFFGHATFVVSDDNVPRWLAVRDQVLAAHTCPTVPVWRPVTRDEIQPGWEVRARYESGHEATWGAAHHRDPDGDWRTGSHVLLTNAHSGWTCETTAPLPEPEPVDPRVEVLAEEMEAEWPHCNDEWPCDGAARFRDAARRAIARLDEMGGEGK